MRTFVKIHRRGENFWCEIVERVAPGIIRVRVDNDLIGALHALKMGNVVNIRSSEVLDVMEAA